MVRQQGRKCPNCKDEAWADVQTMIAYEDVDTTRARRKKERAEKLEERRKDFEAEESETYTPEEVYEIAALNHADGPQGVDYSPNWETPENDILMGTIMNSPEWEIIQFNEKVLREKPVNFNTYLIGNTPKIDDDTPIVIDRQANVIDGNNRFAGALTHGYSVSAFVPKGEIWWFDFSDKDELQEFNDELDEDLGKQDCDCLKEWCFCNRLGAESETSIPSNISFLMRAFEDSGFTILVVGGAVRDSLLGGTPKDYDLATNAKPDEIKRVVKNLKGYRYVLGPQAEKSLVNLTSLVTVPNEEEAIEITTFRKELGYAGDRTQGVFEPADTFEEDAQRRDLTINAMGMTVEGEIIDPEGGREDLEKGVIRAVGDPTQRFVEDPLRMIRAIRFAVRFGLPIEENTYQAIVSNADLVTTLSGRRLRDEIGKVLVEPNGYQILMETGILPILMPEFRDMKEYRHKLDFHPEDTLYNHYIEAFKTFTQIPHRTEIGAWALLFHDIAKPQTAEWGGEYHTFYGHDTQGAKLVLDNYNNADGPFEFSKKELNSIAWTTDNHLQKFWEMKRPTKVANMRNNENWPILVQVVTGDTMGIRRGGEDALAVRIKEIDEITNKINEQEAKTGNRPPGFSQKLIKELGVQGIAISIALNEIEEMVSTGQVQSYEEALEVLKTKRNA